MLFPTFEFAGFFLLVFIGFWYVFRRARDRKLFLIAASYFFYSLWDWRFSFLLLASTAANYGFAFLIGRSREHLRRKLFLVLAVAANLLFLGFFKYWNFFAQSATGVFGALDLSWSLPVLAVVMPVGISFYTFKALSYVFDVYLCKIAPASDPLDVVLYVSFFPQIASGPIVHAADFLPGVGGAVAAGIEPGSKPIAFDRATLLILSGLFKKLVFANFLSTLFVDPVLSDPLSHGTLENLIGALGYSVVMYADFSGYSEMAIGVALLLGFETPANFNRPYVSFSVTEFWKRWHITFSSWLREYLYFAMGGSRFGKARTVVALFFTMALGGLWHGAALTFLVWGVMQGAALALERGFEYGTKRSPVPWKAVLQVLATFTFTALSWIVFRAPSLSAAGEWFRGLLNVSVPPDKMSPLVAVLLVLGLAMQAVPTRARKTGFRWYIALPLPVKAVAVAAALLALGLVSMSGVAPFIYFQF